MKRSGLFLTVVLLPALAACGGAAAPSSAPPASPPAPVASAAAKTSTAPASAAAASAAASASAKPAPAASASAAAKPAGSLTSVRLRLDFKISGQEAPYYLTKDTGYYSDAGLDVTIDEGSGSADSAKLAGTGNIDFGIVDGATLMTARSQGIPVVSLAVLYQKTPITIFSIKDKLDLKSPADLKGRTVGNNPKSATSIGLDAFLKANNISKDQVKIVPIGFDVQPLLTGQVEAMTGFATNEPLVVQAQGKQTTQLDVGDFGVKLYGLTIATNENMIKNKPDVVRNFVAATIKGWKYSIDHPDEAVADAVKVSPQLKAGLETQIFKVSARLTGSDTTKSKGFGYQDESLWAATGNTLADTGQITSKPDVSKLFTNDFLPK